MVTALDYMGASEHIAARMKAAEVLAKVPGANTITHVWGYDPNVDNVEHHSGNAADFMVFQDKALGDRIYAYLWSNRQRLGVRHIIWQQSITSTVVDPGVRRPMNNRGNDTDNHRDHVHVLFFDTAYVKPAIPRATRRPYPGKVISRGAKGYTVGLIQRVLGLKVDNDFGPITEHAVKVFQWRKGLTQDGKVGPITWGKLFP